MLHFIPITRQMTVFLPTSFSASKSSTEINPECSRLHRRRQCSTCRCRLVSVKPSSGTLLLYLHRGVGRNHRPLSVLVRFLSEFDTTVIGITTLTHRRYRHRWFYGNQPTFPFRNSSSVIPSPSVDILTSLASLYLPRCCSHEDMVTLARFPILCSADSLIDDVSAARFPRLLCRRGKKLAAVTESCFCLLTGSSPSSLYDRVISEIVLRRHIRQLDARLFRHSMRLRTSSL